MISHLQIVAYHGFLTTQTHNQVRFLKLMVVFTLFCSVMKATKGKTAALEEQTMEQAFRKLFQDNFRLYFRYFDMYRLATNLITFCLCYIKQDILHVPLLIFGLITSTSRNGTSGMFFEYIWSTYSWYFVFVIIFVNVCTLPSLVPSLIALERFLTFDQIMDDVGASDTYANAAANSTRQMVQSDDNPKLAYSIINAYSIDYHIGNKLLVILGIGCSVTQLRILQRRIKEFKSKTGKRIPCCGISRRPEKKLVPSSIQNMFSGRNFSDKTEHGEALGGFM